MGFEPDKTFVPVEQAAVDFLSKAEEPPATLPFFTLPQFKNIKHVFYSLPFDFWTDCAESEEKAETVASALTESYNACLA